MANSERLERLQNIEQDISKMLTLATDAIEEVSRDKPSNEIVEYKTKDFLRTLEGIEKGISEEISYLTRVSTTQAHEGSAYGVEKDYELTCLQATLAKERLQQFTLKSKSSSNGHCTTNQIAQHHSGI